jgi:glycosyltransferase involved in cell wall biosynthesis
MKKIAIVILANKRGGGVYQYAQSIIEALRDDDKNHYIIICYEDDHRFDSYPFEIRRIKNQKKFHYIKYINDFLLNVFSVFSKKTLFKYSDIDLFFSLSINAYPHFFMNKPFIFTLHDLQNKYFPHYFPPYERIRRNIINKTLSRRAEKIVCESHFVKRDIEHFLHIKSDKISVIPSPPIAEFIKFNYDNNTAQSIKLKYDLPDKYLFYPAQTWYHKNHLRLIDAFKKVLEKHPDVHLLFSGSHRNNYKNIIRKIETENLSDRIRFLGYIDEQDITYIFKMSAMLIMPSLFESISIPVYEAFALKIPVCCSNVFGLSEQVGEAGLLFDPNNATAMAEKINILLENEELAEDKKQKGYSKIINYDFAEYQRKISMLFE